jgi:urease accessory protein UreF
MDQPNSDPIYESEPGDDREIARAIRVCLMGTTAFPVLTFEAKQSGREAFLKAWKTWHEDVFYRYLAPHLVRCHQAISANEVDEALEADCMLDERLGEAFGADEPRDRSAAAGSALYGSIDGARHVRQMDRFRKAVAEQRIPGHFATGLAVEAALFHVPLMHLLPACLFAEWRGALVGCQDEGSLANSQKIGLSIGQFIEAAGDAIRSSRETVQSSLSGAGRLVVCA